LDTKQAQNYNESMTEVAHVIQVSDIQAMVLLVGIGVAWGSLKSDMHSLKNSVHEINERLHVDVLPSIQDVRERLVKVENRVEVLSMGKF
jgi:hypothetical protein